MLRADQARVGWNPEKKRWEVRIQVGSEVMKRPIPQPHETGEADLKVQAVATAKDEGYELDPGHVVVDSPRQAT